MVPDPAAFHELLESAESPVTRKLLPEAGQALYKAAYARTPVRTGATRSSLRWYIQPAPGGGYEVIVAGDQVYTFLEKPASQMHRAQHPLSLALNDVRI